MNENATTANHQKNYSPSWQRRFDLLDSLDADKLSMSAVTKTEKYKSLSFWQKFRLMRNFLAFFFGGLYYLCKGMWAKGLFIIGASSLYGIILLSIEISAGRIVIPTIVYWLPPAVIASQLANFDYYRKEKLGEKIWAKIPAIFADLKITLPLAIIALATNFYLGYHAAMTIPDPYFG
jgi:hypothetical protein